MHLEDLRGCLHDNRVTFASVQVSLRFPLMAVYDICRLQTADCVRQQDCKLNETKNIVIKVASSSTLPCSEKYMHVRPRSEVFSRKLHRPDS